MSQANFCWLQHTPSFRFLSSLKLDAEKLPSLSSHYLLAIWHTHAVRMCVSIELLLLLEVSTEVLALGYRTILVL